VQPHLAVTALPLEVLDRVGDEDLLTLDAGFHQHGIEETAGRPDERTAGAVLAIAGLLADQHERCRHRPLPEHDLGRVPVERAVGAGGGLPLPAGERAHAPSASRPGAG
jgi:hypothetical protein